MGITPATFHVELDSWNYCLAFIEKLNTMTEMQFKILIPLIILSTCQKRPIDSTVVHHFPTRFHTITVVLYFHVQKIQFLIQIEEEINLFKFRKLKIS